MSFWEDLGNTLSEGSTGIFQKIRNETDAVSLRAENAAAERRIRESCETIGRLLTEGSLAILEDSEIEEVLAQGLFIPRGLLVHIALQLPHAGLLAQREA